jgi:hypothetical protein
MTNQPHLFEQTLPDAALAAKESLAGGEAKRQADLDKLGRRVLRERLRRARIPDQVALCGINYYNRSPRTRANGSFWDDCIRCGQPLQYYDTYEEAKAHNRECKNPTGPSL